MFFFSAYIPKTEIEESNPNLNSEKQKKTSKIIFYNSKPVFIF